MAKGFRKKAKTFVLEWPADHDNHGLEVRVKSVPVSKLLKLVRLMDKVTSDGMSGSAETLTELFTLFGDAVIEWNLEDEDGNPVPATADGVESQDLVFTMEMIVAWMTGMAGVSPPLSDASGSGEISPEASLHLASTSESLAS